MKRIFIYTVFILIIGSGCNKQLDIKPEAVFTEQIVVSNPSTAESALASVYYKTFQATVTPGIGGLCYNLGDASTDISQYAPSQYSPYVNGGLLSTDPLLPTIWNSFYSAINEANVLINELPKQSWDESLRNTFIAEAKFLRAYNYFGLLRLFGDGALNNKPGNLCVPLQLNNFSGYDPSENIPRSKNSEVYAQIFHDLDEATAGLTNNETVALKIRTRAQKATCQALAARVALYMGDYDKTISNCDQVLSVTSKYSLLATPLLVFPNNQNSDGRATPYPLNNEQIFVFATSWNKNLNDVSGITYSQRAVIWTDSTFQRKYPANDLRGTMFYKNTTANPFRLSPFKFSAGSNTFRDNITIFRLAEIYLTKAEALAKKNGVNQVSIDLLNAIRRRAYTTATAPPPYTTSSFANGADLIQIILQERYFELAFENHDRYDKIRNGIVPNASMTNPQKWVLPIPAAEIVYDPLLVQNPGY